MSNPLCHVFGFPPRYSNVVAPSYPIAARFINVPLVGAGVRRVEEVVVARLVGGVLNQIDDMVAVTHSCSPL